MKIRRILAAMVLCLTVFSGSVFSVRAEQEMSANKAVKNQGSIGVSVMGTGGAEVIIEEKTPEGLVTVFDKKAENQENYRFLLPACEYDIYKKDYVSSYRLTVKSLLDPMSTYTFYNIIIADTGFETDITGSEYNYFVTLSKSSGREITSSVETAGVEEGVLKGGGRVTLFYKPYTLGDVNADNAIDSRDATAILISYASALTDDYTISAEIFPEGDFNEDGVVDSRDATAILVAYARYLIEL